MSLEGAMGSGKTTGAVALATEDSKALGIKIVSNVHLNWPMYQHFDLLWFLEHIVDTELENCIVLLDEAYQTADSRSSGTKINKLFSYFVVQTRKRDVDLYFCTHFLDHVDLRFRRAVDIRASCRSQESPCSACRCPQCHGRDYIGGNGTGARCPTCGGVGGTGQRNGKPCEKCLGYGKIGFVRMMCRDRRRRIWYPIDIFGNKYWHLFNTKERIALQARILQGIDVTEVG